ncbi:hypothetical protein SDC9_205967 [bioreactor metagenome]|uniref:Uncharacterized protein n=1 Tax=bioreactor metagenome TaxID=1076179 RepID=A0A645JCY0_9ZZZZ
MARHDMPAHAVADPERPLDIEQRAGLQLAEVGPPLGFGQREEFQHAAGKLAFQREAAAVDRHALAVNRMFEFLRRLQRQMFSVQPDQRAGHFHQAGKHFIPPEIRIWRYPRRNASL